MTRVIITQGGRFSLAVAALLRDAAASEIVTVTEIGTGIITIEVERPEPLRGWPPIMNVAAPSPVLQRERRTAQWKSETRGRRP